MANGTCSVEGCDRDAYLRGWCAAHYRRFLAYGTVRSEIPIRERSTGICDVDDCERAVHAGGMCEMHYRRKQKGTVGMDKPPRGWRRCWAENDLVKFVLRVVPTDNGCWEWQGAITTAGYSEIQAEGKTHYGHRWIYEQIIGPIPAGLTIDHTCHNRDPHCPGGPCSHRRCVNPNHLEAVTHKVNITRAMQRQR